MRRRGRDRTDPYGMTRRGCRSVPQLRYTLNSNKTEIYVKLLKREKELSHNLFYSSEIGIGETKEEALKNYKRFTFEENSDFTSTFDR